MNAGMSNWLFFAKADVTVVTPDVSVVY